MTEEERAKQYREQAQRREQAALARWKALAGSASAYAQLLARTKAVMHDPGWDPVEYVLETERAANG